MTDSRTNYGKQISNLIRQAYGKHLKVFEQTISRSVRAAENQCGRQSIFCLGGLIAIIPKDWKYLRGDIYYVQTWSRISAQSRGGSRPVVVLQNDVKPRPTLIVATASRPKKDTSHTRSDGLRGL